MKFFRKNYLLNTFVFLLICSCSSVSPPEEITGEEIRIPGTTVSCTGQSNAKKPNSTNTGPAGTLTAYSGNTTISTAGTIIENVTITGTIYIDANDVIIRNFEIDSDNSWYGIVIKNGLSGIEIEDGEIYNMRSAAILGMGFIARRLNIHDSGGDGVKVQGTGGPVEFLNSYIHRIGTEEGAHADGNQTRGGSEIAFCYNNIDLPAPGTANFPGAPYKANATFILNSGDIDNFLIGYNWLNGGGWTIYGEPGVYVMNNFFGRDYSFGIKTGEFSVWSNNVWEDTGELIP